MDKFVNPFNPMEGKKKKFYFLYLKQGKDRQVIFAANDKELTKKIFVSLLKKNQMAVARGQISFVMEEKTAEEFTREYFGGRV